MAPSPILIFPFIPTWILHAVCGCIAPPAVEGEYCPWVRELQQSRWLQLPTWKEDPGTCKGTHTSSCPPSTLTPWQPPEIFPKSRSHMGRSVLKSHTDRLWIPPWTQTSGTERIVCETATEKTSAAILVNESHMCPSTFGFKFSLGLLECENPHISYNSSSVGP